MPILHAPIRSQRNRAGFSLAALTVALVGMSTASTAQANDKYLESIRKCTTIENDVVRLACFDKAASWLMINKNRSGSYSSNQQSRDSGESTPATALAPVEGKSAMALEAERRRLEQEVQDLRRERQTLSRERGPDGDFRNSRVENLQATVTKLTDLPYDKVRVYLDNGQVWDTTDSGFVPGLKVGATVILNEAMFGSHTMKVDGKRGEKRVKRQR